MSARAASVRPLRVSSPEFEQAQRFHVVTGQKTDLRRSAWPFVLLATLLLLITIALPMVVNTHMAQRAYEIRDMQIALTELNASSSTLEANLLAASSPSSLAAKAKEMGLVPAGSAGAISLSNSTVEGGVPAE